MIGKILNSKKGFTLVEMLIAVGIFVVITSFSLGAILSIFDANNKARSLKTVMDNLNLAIEDMTRTVHFGTNYHCTSSGSTSAPRNCPNGDDYLVVNFKGSSVAYRKHESTMQRADGGTSFKDITSSDTVIQYLKFYVFNSSSSVAGQPYIVVVIKGYVGTKPTTQSTFSIETVISQRTLDL